MNMKTLSLVICLAFVVSVKAQPEQEAQAQITQEAQNQIKQFAAKYPDYEQYASDMVDYMSYVYLTSRYYPTMEEAYFWVKARPPGIAKRMLTHRRNQIKNQIRQKKTCKDLKMLYMLTKEEDIKMLAIMNSCY